MLGKDAMFMLEELRAARGDMEGEEGVSSIRWASGLLGRRGSLKTCLSSFVIVCHYCLSWPLSACCGLLLAFIRLYQALLP